MKLLIILSILILPSLSQGISVERINHYENILPADQRFRTDRPVMQIRRNQFFVGETRPKMALKGVFIWGGSDRRQKSLSKNMKQHLCRQRFAKAYYVYGEPNEKIRCDGHSLDYRRIKEARFTYKGVNQLLNEIYQIIHSQDLGPIYLHCWYGVHASNTIAQIVLKQFCGISNEEAIANWNAGNLYGGLKADKVRKNHGAIRNFVPIESLKISKQIQSQICY